MHPATRQPSRHESCRRATLRPLRRVILVGVTQDDAPRTAQARTEEPLRVRRSPQLSRFLIAGGLLGFVGGALLGLLGPDAPTSTQGQEVVLLGTIGALLVGFLAAVLYLVLDRRGGDA